MKSIFSKVIGKLVQDNQFDNWWQSDSLMEIPLFDLSRTSVIFTGFEPESDIGFIDSADVALQNFLSLKSDSKLDISNYVYQNFK